MPDATSASRRALTKYSVGLTTETLRRMPCAPSGIVPRASRTGLPAPRCVSSASGPCAADVRIALRKVSPLPRRLDAGQGRLVDRCTRRDHEAGGVLIELQRPHAGREAPVEIVPGPAGPEQHVGQPVVVADHAAGDHGNPPRLQLTRPAAEQFCGFAVPVVEARVAAAGHDEIAVEHAAVDRPRQRKLGGEREVPSEPLGGRGERDDLDVGCGEEELLGVSRVEDFVAPQRSDRRCPSSRARVPARRAGP